MEPIPHNADGPVRQHTQDRGAVPAEDVTNETLDNGGPNAGECRVSSKEPSLNLYAKDSETLATASPVEIGSEDANHQGAEQEVDCRGASANNQIILHIPPAHSLVSSLELTNVGKNDAGESGLVSVPIDEGAPTSTGIEFPLSDADMESPLPAPAGEIGSPHEAHDPEIGSPHPAHDAEIESPQPAPAAGIGSPHPALDAEIGSPLPPQVEIGIEFPPTDADTRSPEPQTKPKACQLTVAECLAEFRVRSRSPSPIPLSQPQGTPSSRPPRKSQTRRNSSPPAMKLVPTVSPTKSASKGGKSMEEPKLYLDAILSKLTPIEQAKYLRAKAEVSAFPSD